MRFHGYFVFDSSLEFPNSFEQFLVVCIPQAAAMQITADFANGRHQLAHSHHGRRVCEQSK
jgi:hypothetical protein